MEHGRAPTRLSPGSRSLAVAVLCALGSAVGAAGEPRQGTGGQSSGLCDCNPVPTATDQSYSDDRCKPVDYEVFDYYAAAPCFGAGPKTCVVFLHGGGFLEGITDCAVLDKSAIDACDARLFEDIRDAGMVLISANYGSTFDLDEYLDRNCEADPPASVEAPFPHQAESVKRLIRFLRMNAATYEIDPDAICIVGQSAGGVHAALAAFGAELGGPASSRPDALVCWGSASSFLLFDQGYTNDVIELLPRHLLGTTAAEKLSEVPLPVQLAASPATQLNLHRPDVPTYLAYWSASSGGGGLFGNGVTDPHDGYFGEFYEQVFASVGVPTAWSSEYWVSGGPYAIDEGALVAWIQAQL